MERYLGAGCGVLVLCGNETRAKNLQRLLEERGLRAQLDLKNTRLPVPVSYTHLLLGLGDAQLRHAHLAEVLAKAVFHADAREGDQHVRHRGVVLGVAHICLLYTSRCV